MASDDKPESFSYPLWCEDVAVDRLDADRERSAFIYSSLSDGVDRFVFQVLADFSRFNHWRTNILKVLLIPIRQSGIMPMRTGRYGRLTKLRLL